MGRKTRAEEDAAFGKAMRQCMEKRRMSREGLANKWGYPKWYIDLIIDKGWLPLDVEISEICKILGIKKRWQGWDVI
jgi:hypothetical protein